MAFRTQRRYEFITGLDPAPFSMLRLVAVRCDYRAVLAVAILAWQRPAGFQDALISHVFCLWECGHLLSSSIILAA
jgi:hypothetical protein